MKKLLLNDKGITMLALVVTVVILAILAYSTVRVSIGNKGIIQEAENVANAQSTQMDVENAAVTNVLKNK